MRLNWKLQAESNHGTAGEIRGIFYRSLEILAGGVSLAVIAGVFFDTFNLMDQRVLWLLVLLINTAGILTAVLYGKNALRRVLSGIQQVEDALIDLSEVEHISVQRHRLAAGQDAPDDLVQVYNRLVIHLQDMAVQRVDYLSRVSHDLRSPLASILGYAELLADTNLRGEPGFVEQASGAILAQAELVNQLAQDMIIAARLEAGVYNMQMKSFKLPRLIEDLVTEVRRQTGRELTVENQVGDVLVEGDMLYLRQAMINLVDNGVKYSPPDRPVFVRLVPAEKPGWIAVAIQDYGIGIEASDQDKVFDRFARLQNEQTRGIPGTGLGLYIASNIIQRHNGELSVRSQPGQGSTFTVNLPVGM